MHGGRDARRHQRGHNEDDRAGTPQQAHAGPGPHGPWVGIAVAHAGSTSVAVVVAPVLERDSVERVGAEEGLAHHGELEHLPWWPAGEHRAPVHGHETISELRDEGDVVLHDEHGGVEPVAHSAEEPDHGLDLALGHTRGRLVQQDHGRLQRHDGRQVDQAPRAGRQLAHQTVGVAVEAEHVQNLVDPLSHGGFGPHLERQAQHGVEGVADVGEPFQ